MDYQKQINTFVNYFKNAESRKENHKIGVEFEHFILDKDLKAVSYYGEKGIEDLLNELSKNGWDKVFEDKNLIGLKSDQKVITLEPGGQLELSITPKFDLNKIEEIYLNFIEELLSVLNKWNYRIAVLGYQPKTLIRDIKMLPKKRYDFMYKYFQNKGKYAYNMMKGTASVQMSIDYLNEEDYIKKMRVAYFITPLIYYLFDNTPFFEGEKAAGRSVRESIWTNCDSERSGLIDNLFNKKFGYQDYAKYLLNTPPIIRKKKGELKYTGAKFLRDVMENGKLEEVEHFLSMVFPDVRTKKYIEIRSADALPYPYNFAFIAFLKGLFYNQKNLNYIYQISLNYDQNKFIEFKNKVIYKEKHSRREELIETLIKMSKKALDEEERGFIKLIEELHFEYRKAKLKTLNKLENDKEKALEWCFLN